MTWSAWNGVHLVVKNLVLLSAGLVIGATVRPLPDEHPLIEAEQLPNQM